MLLKKKKSITTNHLSWRKDSPSVTPQFLGLDFYHILVNVLCDVWVPYKFILKYFIKNYIYFIWIIFMTT